MHHRLREKGNYRETSGNPSADAGKYSIIVNGNAALGKHFLYRPSHAMTAVV